MTEPRDYIPLPVGACRECVAEMNRVFGDRGAWPPTVTVESGRLFDGEYCQDHARRLALLEDRNAGR